jgi:hypothetical protein
VKLTIDKFIDLSLLENEEIISSFSDKNGLDQISERDKYIFILTNRRLVKSSRSGISSDLTFLDIKDIHTLELHSQKVSWNPIFRIALFIAGALSSIYIIAIAAIAFVLAIVLVLAAIYLIIDYVNQNNRGLFSAKGTHNSVSILYNKENRKQAALFINNVFTSKEAPVPISKDYPLEGRVLNPDINATNILDRDVN